MMRNMKEYIAKIRAEFIKLVSKPGIRFSDIQEEFLTILYENLDRYRKQGIVPEGEYRQKGNAFRDLILAIIQSQTGLELRGMKIEGFTDKHDLDLGFYLHDVLYIAGQVKLLGSPAHKLLSGEFKPERMARADIDKRIKEVKYTPVDLKLRYGGKEVGRWDDWIRGSIPRFYSFWGCRIANRDNVDLIIQKFLHLKEYNNGVGVVLYREEKGKYAKIDDPRLKELDIDDTIRDISAFLLKEVHPQ